ncbi:hypothetical protein [Methyloceanibacter sp.]|uniref:hypothetical protein n=1 Tax=Methyloceanibacter sp. TaxID=1965321 RepID=UPI002D55C636|nr:hypothetical protein [Methyloceanibacter sp.]HZP08827.1 hypothetical protein [Methyloceanibacter sp.]
MSKGNSEVLSSFAEVDSEAVVTLLERVLGTLEPAELKDIEGDIRRHLVWALEKIAFVANTFECGAVLLLDLAVAESEDWGNNATGQFKALFPALLADTEAGPEARLQIIDDIIARGESSRLSVVVDALLEGAKTTSFSRSVGSEFHGSRPALRPWTPKVWKEAWDYVTECANRLAKLATRSDEVGARARAGLGHQFRMFVAHGLIEDVEKWTVKVATAHRYWPEALASLGDILQYDVDSLQPGVEARVRTLIKTLTPNELADRVQFLVTEMPWDFPGDEKLDFDTRGKRQVEAVDHLVAELLRDEKALLRFLPQLSRGNQRMASEFGHSLATRARDPFSWRGPLMAAIEAVPAKERNFSLLAGYFARLAERDPAAFEEFKQQAAESAVFAPALPLVCWSAGIRDSDISLVCKGLKAGLIPTFPMMQWTLGGKLAKLRPASVAPLFDQMLRMEQPFYSIALDLMGMYVHGQAARLNELRPQLRLAASFVGKRQKKHPRSQMDEYHFKELMEWILSKGSQDADAGAIAMTIAKQLVADPSDDGADLIKPLLRILLADFAQTVWPLIGQAIVSDRKKAWLFELTLGDSPSFDDKPNPPILGLPEDMLFAWCHAHPDAGPAFVARVAPVLTSRSPDAVGREFHPIVKRLLNDFGNRDDVLNALFSNMHTFGWSGSRTTYYALYEEPLRGLENHPIGAVRRWAKKMSLQMRRAVDAARDEDEEQQVHWGV